MRINNALPGVLVINGKEAAPDVNKLEAVNARNASKVDSAALGASSYDTDTYDKMST